MPASSMRIFSVVMTLALTAVIPSGPAKADPIACSTTDTFTNGIGTVPFSSLNDNFCVVAQDKLFGNFNLTSLPSGGNLLFNLTTVGNIDHHQLSFNAPYQPGNTYSFSYDVQVDTATAVPGTVITQLDSDFNQTASTSASSLTKNTVPLGDPASGIDIAKNNGTPTPGSVFTIDYLPGGVAALDITEQLIDNGNPSSITNTVSEAVGGVPEPASLGLLGAGIVGLSLLRPRRR